MVAFEKEKKFTPVIQEAELTSERLAGMNDETIFKYFNPCQDKLFLLRQQLEDAEKNNRSQAKQLQTQIDVLMPEYELIRAEINSRLGYDV